VRSINKNVKVSVLCGDAENYERVFDFINSVDKSFPIPLSERADISVFTKKILDKAIILQAVIDDEIVGLSSFYANDLDNMKSHWTFLAVKSSHMNMGIASKLITEMLSILRNRKMVSVELTTESDNIAARSLYEKMRFRLVEEKDERVRYVYSF
jgi:ribosomal protein S18 acetylase RimI-like enzyme